MTTPAPLRTLCFLAFVHLASLNAVTAAPLTGGPRYEYSTSGSVGGATEGGPPGTIWFRGIGTASPLLAPGSISLGQFESRPLPEGAGRSYHDVPFHITMYIAEHNDDHSYYSPMSIEGVLNGTVSGTTYSDVVATVTSALPQTWKFPPPFPLSSFHIDSPQLLDAPGVNGGRTTLNARIDDPIPPPIPEPASWAVFALALAAGLHRFRRTG